MSNPDGPIAVGATETGTVVFFDPDVQTGIRPLTGDGALVAALKAELHLADRGVDQQARQPYQQALIARVHIANGVAAAVRRLDRTLGRSR